MGQSGGRACREGIRQVGAGVTVRPEGYSERILAVDGWQVRLTTYKLGDHYVCKADNVSPGANLARIAAATQQEAEEKALARATQLLARTKRHEV